MLLSYGFWNISLIFLWGKTKPLFKLGFQNGKKNCFDKHSINILSNLENVHEISISASSLVLPFFKHSLCYCWNCEPWGPGDRMEIFFLSLFFEVVMFKPEYIAMFQYLFQALLCCSAKIASLRWHGYFSQRSTIWKVHRHGKSKCHTPRAVFKKQ